MQSTQTSPPPSRLMHVVSLGKSWAKRMHASATATLTRRQLILDREYREPNTAAPPAAATPLPQLAPKPAPKLTLEAAQRRHAAMVRAQSAGSSIETPPSSPDPSRRSPSEWSDEDTPAMPRMVPAGMRAALAQAYPTPASPPPRGTRWPSAGSAHSSGEESSDAAAAIGAAVVASSSSPVCGPVQLRANPVSTPKGNLLKLECFYCVRRLRTSDAFVVCDKCDGFFACAHCWAAVDHSACWMRCQQALLLKRDRERLSSQRRWPKLAAHRFTMRHSNSERAPLGFSLTCWDEFRAASAPAV